jgi:hypothetical protein
VIKFINLIFKYAPAGVAMRRGWDVCKYSNDFDSFVFGLPLLARFFVLRPLTATREYNS